MNKESTSRLTVAYVGINCSYWVRLTHRKGPVFMAQAMPKQLGGPQGREDPQSSKATCDEVKP